MRILFALLTILYCWNVCAEDVLSMKGIVIGMTQAELLEKHKGFSCVESACLANPTLKPEHESLFRYGTGIAKSWYVSFHQGKVERVMVTMHMNPGESTALSLQEKYGTPKVVEDTVRTKVGVEHKRVTKTWEQGNQRITATLPSSAIDVASFTLSDVV